MRSKTAIIIGSYYSLCLIFFGVTLSRCSHKDERTIQKVGSSLFILQKNSKTQLNFENTLHEDIYSNENVLTFDNFYNGAGVSLGDINNDGLVDIFLSGNQVSSKLFLNNGNLQFTEITETSGISTKNIWANGVTMSDVNQDGWLDIYICAGGPSLDPNKRRNQLWINQQNGTFINMAQTMGVDDARWSNHSSFFDMDQDGDLDLFVMNHTTYWRVSIPEVDEIMQNDSIRSLASNQLYENLGNGKFKNITKTAGIEKHTYGLGLVTTDLNADGLTDIYVANDYSVPDFMFINLGNGKFQDQNKQRTKQISFYGMGCDIADYNNDSYPEIVVVDMAIKDHYRNKTLMSSMNTDLFNYLTKVKNYPHQYMFNSFQLNNQNGTYSNISNAIGLSKTDWSWTALLADFDQDQNKDLIISNGIVRYPRDNDFRLEMDRVKKQNNGSVPNKEKERLYNMMPSIPLVNKLYKNTGQLQFEDMTSEWGFNEEAFSYGCGYADLDNDGDLDLVFNNTNSPASIYENTSNSNYLKVDVRDPQTNVLINNAKVHVWTNGKSQSIEITPSRGYFSSSEPLANFGLKEISIIDSVIVDLPGNKKLKATHVNINQTVTTHSSQFKKVHPNTSKTQPSIFANRNPLDFGINYSHYENPYNEYKKEILLPHSQSSFGPFSSVSDVNNDGLEDLFIGGGSNQSGILYTQNADGTFIIPENQPWVNHYKSEDLGSAFFDANNDGFVDLYVVSGGGSEFENREDLLQDRLYLNDQKGGFYYAEDALPQMSASGMRVQPTDFDNDGDMDLFVGGRTKPGAYPTAPTSYLLENQSGVFIDVTKDIGHELAQLGMVTDFKWCDFDNNGFTDLIISSEWQPIRIFLNSNGTFTDHTENYDFGTTSGWFYSIDTYDFNQDGQLDIIAGNVGLNNKYGVSTEKPLHIFMNDFDANGTNDIVLSKKYKKSLVPVRGRECSSQQMPFITKKFESYSSFAEASLNDIYTQEKLDESIHYTVNNFSSLVFLSDPNGGYITRELPIQAQLSCVNDILLKDLTNDGIPEIIGIGNQYNTEPETPRYDASNGFILHYSNGKFQSLPYSETGLFLPQNSKSIIPIKIQNQDHLIIGNNGGIINILQLKN